MPFDRFNLGYDFPRANDKRWMSYRTSEALSAVEVAGYFDAIRSDVDNAYTFVRVYAADGDRLYAARRSGDAVVLSPMDDDGTYVAVSGTPPQGFSTRFTPGKLTLPTAITALWTPEIDIIRRADRWRASKSVRQLRPASTGQTYYVDGQIQNSSADGVEVTITGATQANPVVISYSGDNHPTNARHVWIAGVGGMDEINNAYYRIDAVDTVARTFELLSVDGTGFDAYTSGGTFIEPLNDIEEALEKPDVSRVMVAPGNTGGAGAWGSASITTSENAIALLPWRIRGGDVVVSNGTALNANGWTEDGTYAGVYSATASTTTKAVFDLAHLDRFGAPTQYIEVRGGSEAQRRLRVQSTPGSWTLEGGTIHVHALSGGPPGTGSLVIANAGSLFVTWDKHIHVEDFDFVGLPSGFWWQDNSGNGNSKLTMAGCRFIGATNDTTGNGATIDGVSESYFEDCEALGNARDGYNYHDQNGVPAYAMEIRCKAFDNGRTADTTNNGSSMHDSGIIIRLNGEAGQCNGPSYTDVGGSKSFNVSCRSLGSSLADASVQDADFYNSGSEMWLADCEAPASDRSLVVTSGGVTRTLNTEAPGTITESGGTVEAYVP